jgi:hypothetical protein
MIQKNVLIALKRIGAKFASGHIAKSVPFVLYLKETTKD